MGADEGYFPSGTSVLRRVQGERSVGLLYGQRALIIGALDARNYVGTATHSRYRDEPFRRLVATAKMFETIHLGTKAEADKVLAVVHKMHSAVRGELPEDAGVFEAGTSYSAFDPELMLWTIAVAADSSLYFYERLVRSMSPSERDQFWADWVRFGELFGMPTDVAPVGWEAFATYMHDRLHSDEMHLTDEALHVGKGVAFHIPFGSRAVQWTAGEAHNLLILGSLPGVVREHFGLSWSLPQELAYRVALEGVKRSRPLTPRSLARGPNRGRYEQVARREAEMIEAGRPPIDMAAA